MATYNPSDIEAKWQATWEQEGIFAYDPKSKRKRFYCLDMFPYPLRSGMHLGHLVGFAASDVLSRAKKMQGFNVLHPIGFDSFGLPAEQQALASGKHPSEITEIHCDQFVRQLKQAGLSYDWERMINTCDPNYYKWTQWIFLKLFNSWYDPSRESARPIDELEIPIDVEEDGEYAVEEFKNSHRLAYISDAIVNWCPYLETVLSDEEIKAGRTVRGGHRVERRWMKQWMLRISAYADRLIEDLDSLDWPSNIKEQQKHWIGRHEGVEIYFSLENSDQVITTFTTRPETIYGVTFFVVSAEHPLIEELTHPELKESVSKYIENTKLKPDLDRDATNHKKTGQFTGKFVINPINSERVPVYVGEYVSAQYGSNSMMGVPAHDEGDFEFARTFQIPIKSVLVPVEIDINTRKALESGEYPWSGSGVMLPIEHETAKLLELEGMQTWEACDVISDWLVLNRIGRRTTHYRLNDWLFSRQRYWGEPIPIVHWEDGMVRGVSKTELPVELPKLASKSSDLNSIPLACNLDWLKVEAIGGMQGKREHNTMPQWAGSCWYYLRFFDPLNEAVFFKQEMKSSTDDVDLYIGGAEQAVLHLLYSRFWHKVLYDLDLVNTKEPFKKFIAAGAVLTEGFQDRAGNFIAGDQVELTPFGSYKSKETGESIEKVFSWMSRSKESDISLSEILEKHGADVLRLHLLSMGPIDQLRTWDESLIVEAKSFLTNVWNFIKEKSAANGFSDKKLPQVRAALHRAAKKIKYDLEDQKFDTAIRSLIEAFNIFSENTISEAGIKFYLRLLYPFVPHLSEELWQVVSPNDRVSDQAWPEYDENLIRPETIEVIIQIDGKNKMSLEVDRHISEDDLKNQAKIECSKIPFIELVTIYDEAHAYPRVINFITQ
ncbi:MAG: leucine--tRNA ligase [Bdellovibrionota bacterium]